MFMYAYVLYIELTKPGCQQAHRDTQRARTTELSKPGTMLAAINTII
jgi:hypothetical protein